jgi:hypothetical protein
MLKFMILVLISSNFGCGIHAKNSYESNLKSYRFEDVVVYISYEPIEEKLLNEEVRRTYNLFYDEAIRSLGTKGYRTVRLSDGDISKIGYNARINFSNGFLTNTPYKFSYSDSLLDSLFKKHRTVMLIKVLPRYSYSTAANNVIIKYLDRCVIEYALLDSNSQNVIALGPGPDPYHPRKNYQRSTSSIISSETTTNVAPRDPQTGRIVKSTILKEKISGYNESEENFIKGIASSLFSELPELKTK